MSPFEYPIENSSQNKSGSSFELRQLLAQDEVLQVLWD